MTTAHSQSITPPAIATDMMQSNTHDASKAAAIKAVATLREIPFLVHFTPIDNLASILKVGLYSRDLVAELDCVEKMYTTDTLRLDKRTNRISLSIAHPNSSMLYKKRRLSGVNQRWAILLLKPDILWEKDCLFFSCNAASNQAKQIPEAILNSATGLTQMYYPCESRQTNRLYRYDPTDEQAEVMVKNHIEPDYIMAAVFNETHSVLQFSELAKTQNINAIKDNLNLFNTRRIARQPTLSDFLNN